MTGSRHAGDCRVLIVELAVVKPKNPKQPLFESFAVIYNELLVTEKSMVFIDLLGCTARNFSRLELTDITILNSETLLKNIKLQRRLCRIDR